MVKAKKTQVTQEVAGESGMVQGNSINLPVPVSASTPVASGKKQPEQGEVEEYSADMGNLNSRLAAIVDRNNGIQSENQRLRDQLATVQDNHKAELDKVKTLYDTELAEARRLLDLEAARKVEQDLELKNAKLEVKELREKTAQHLSNEQVSKDLAEQLQAQLDAARADNQTLKRKMQSAKTDKDELTMQLTSAKSDLDKAKKEAEQNDLRRMNLENELQSLKEQFEMTRRVHAQEMSSQKELMSATMSRSMEEQSLLQNATMSKALDDIRQEHEEQLEKSQGEISKRFEKQLKDAEKKMGRGKDLLDEKRKECSTLKAKADQAATQLARTEQELSRVRDQLRSAEADAASLRSQADWNMDELKQQNEELKKKTNALENKLFEGKEKYGTLLKEVETYRSLLEVEENRLNITPSPVQSKKRTRSRVGTLGSSETSSPPKKARVDPQVEDVGNEALNGDADASCAIM